MRVLVVGDFGRLHRGHLDHILKASYLGDELIVATHPDESIKAKKGYEPDPLYYRVFTLKGWLKQAGIKGEVVVVYDPEGLAVTALYRYKPDIFAKGVDYSDANLPPKEKATCERNGIRIIYGVGDKLGSSRDR